MTRFGNYRTSYDEDVYHYDNADGSQYFSNADGSAYYNPGDSGKRRKWFRSPDGVKHYMPEEPERLEEPEQPSEYRGYSQPGTLHYDCRANIELYFPFPPVVKKQRARRGKSFHPSQSGGRYYNEPEEKEVHVHVPPKRRASPQPMNVTRVVHHSSKRETDVEYRSPAKVGKDGKIGNGERGTEGGTFTPSSTGI